LSRVIIGMNGVTPMPPAKKIDSCASCASLKLLRGSLISMTSPQRSAS
jgi:hypothetical protein